MKLLYQLVIYLLFCFTASGQLVSFLTPKGREYYQAGDSVRVTVMHIDSTQQQTIKISSDLISTISSPKSGTDTNFNLGKITSPGVYNFRFSFDADSIVRYFQVVVPEDVALKEVKEKNYFERIPFDIPVSIDSIQNSFNALCLAINDRITRHDSLWRSQPVVKNASTSLFAYKAYEKTTQSSTLIAGRYYLNDKAAISYLDSMLVDSTLQLLPKNQPLILYLRLLLHGDPLIKIKSGALKSLFKQPGTKRELPAIDLQTLYEPNEPSTGQASLLLLADLKKVKLKTSPKP